MLDNLKTNALKSMGINKLAVSNPELSQVAKKWRLAIISSKVTPDNINFINNLFNSTNNPLVFSNAKEFKKEIHPSDKVALIHVADDDNDDIIIDYNLGFYIVAKDWIDLLDNTGKDTLLHVYNNLRKGYISSELVVIYNANRYVTADFEKQYTNDNLEQENEQCELIIISPSIILGEELITKNKLINFFTKGSNKFIEIKSLSDIKNIENYYQASIIDLSSAPTDESKLASIYPLYCHISNLSNLVNNQTLKQKVFDSYNKFKNGYGSNFYILESNFEHINLVNNSIEKTPSKNKESDMINNINKLPLIIVGDDFPDRDSDLWKRFSNFIAGENKIQYFPTLLEAEQNIDNIVNIISVGDNKNLPSNNFKFGFFLHFKDWKILDQNTLLKQTMKLLLIQVDNNIHGNRIYF